MNWKQKREIKRKLLELNPRLVVREGNYKDEVVFYVRYQAGAMNTYRQLPDEFEGIRLIKDGLEPKIPI